MLRWMAGIFAVGLLGGGALAQTSRPDLLPADEMLRQMLKPVEGASSRPATRPQASFVAGRAGGAGQMIREGTEIYDRPGRLRKIEDGSGEEFVFDDDGSVDPLPDMIVLPDLKLMSMENAESTTSRTLRFMATGTVTEYKGRNYILLESTPDDSVRRNVTPAARQSGDKPRSADQMLSDMLAGPAPAKTPVVGGPAAEAIAPVAAVKSGVPAADASSGAAAVAPGAPVLSVMREGSQIVDRIGRLTKSADGEQAEFTFEADGSAMEDPPLIILPNLKLTTMETSVQSTSKDMIFRVTGSITEYRGRNYILLQKVVVVPEAVQQF